MNTNKRSLLRCFQFIQSVECKGHTGPLCAVDAIYADDSKILVASSASDSTVRLWLIHAGKRGKRHKRVDAFISFSLWNGYDALFPLQKSRVFLNG